LRAKEEGWACPHAVLSGGGGVGVLVTGGAELSRQGVMAGLHWTRGVR